MTVIKTRTLLTALFWLGSAFGQEPAVDNLGSGQTEEDVIPAAWGFEALRAELGLNERQVERLREVDFAREDEMFPYARDGFEHDWELRRALRNAQANEEEVRMIGEDLERIYGEINRVNTEYRRIARAILSSHQIAALDRLERVFESVQAAQEAIRVNLIESPPGYPFGLPPFGPFGTGGFGLFGNLFGLLAEQPDAQAAPSGKIVTGR